MFFFRFRLGCERINYLLLDVKGRPPKRFDINPFSEKLIGKEGICGLM